MAAKPEGFELFVNIKQANKYGKHLEPSNKQTDMSSQERPFQKRNLSSNPESRGDSTRANTVYSTDEERG